jgi:hypothetical protein
MDGERKSIKYFYFRHYCHCQGGDEDKKELSSLEVKKNKKNKGFISIYKIRYYRNKT